MSCLRSLYIHLRRRRRLFFFLRADSFYMCTKNKMRMYIKKSFMPLQYEHTHARTRIRTRTHTNHRLI